MESSWGWKEFKDCGVEDKREARSLAVIADSLLAHPELSFSGAVGKAKRKAAWRIFSKDEVDVSWGHYKQTAIRCEEYRLVMVSHDTTDLSYPGHLQTKGLGDLGGGHGGVNPGICLHSALALSPQGLPLGLVGQKLWAPVATGKGSHNSKDPLEKKESVRWVEALQWVKQYLSKVEQVLMISDSESDFYDYITAPRSKNTALLLRVHHFHRYVYYQQQRLQIRDISFDNTVERPVFLPKAKKRKERQAHLQVSWGKVICPPPWGRTGKEVELWLVKAIETNPAPGEQAIVWYLFTTMPVESQSDALLTLDYYRRRWIVERWHLVLKSGLQVERLQFDCFKRLSKAVAMLSIVAWQLLWLKQLAAQSETEKASLILEPEHIDMLEQQTGKKELTTKDILLIIASLAGFTPSKKQPLPGEKTIWRGWAIFSAMYKGYLIALQKSYGTG